MTHFATALDSERRAMNLPGESMPRAVSLLLVVLLWAAIYVCSLGSLEIKGEEGRRILPAVTMIETGNYLVPHVGSEPYYRKPPLVNWLVAASFQFTGHRNEWTARLPSALVVLAVALAFVTVASASLGTNGSLAAALIWMTSFGIIEKGRLIEIEALYVSLLGLALIFWISWWHQRRSPWLYWIVPLIFLGLGLLAKGPLHLFFFYAIVIAVLHREKELRTLFQLPHILGIMIMLGIFAAWAVPYWQATRGLDVNLTQTWSDQFIGRLRGDDFKLGHWLLNIPKGFVYFLPWTLFLPLVPGAQFVEERDANLFRGLIWGCAIPFLIVNLLPGSLPRYAMPVLPGAAWAIAMLLLKAHDIQAPGWWPFPKILSLEKSLSLVVRVAVVIAFAMVTFSIGVVPLALAKREKIRPIAAQIDAQVPEAETLYAVNPDYQPFLFYSKSRLAYVDRIDQLPATARYFLVQPEKEQEALANEKWAPLHSKAILTLTDYRKKTVILMKVGE